MIMAEINMKILTIFHPCFITCRANQITVLGQKHSIRPDYFSYLENDQFYESYVTYKSYDMICDKGPY